MHQLQNYTLHEKIMSVNHSRPAAEGDLKIKNLYINDRRQTFTDHSCNSNNLTKYE